MKGREREKRIKEGREKRKKKWSINLSLDPFPLVLGNVLRDMALMKNKVYNA